MNEMEEGKQLIDAQNQMRNRTKYLKRNLVSSTNNFLSELLVRLGYEIKFKRTRMTSTVLKMNRIHSITGHGISLSNQREVSQFGLQVNKKILFLFGVLGEKRDAPLDVGYETISDIILPAVTDEEYVVKVLIERGGKVLEREGIVNGKVKVNELFFIKQGFQIKRMEFGWFATSLK